MACVFFFFSLLKHIRYKTSLNEVYFSNGCLPTRKGTRRKGKEKKASFLGGNVKRHKIRDANLSIVKKDA